MLTYCKLFSRHPLRKQQIDYRPLSRQCCCLVAILYLTVFYQFRNNTKVAHHSSTVCSISHHILYNYICKYSLFIINCSPQLLFLFLLQPIIIPTMMKNIWPVKRMAAFWDAYSQRTIII